MSYDTVQRVALAGLLLFAIAFVLAPLARGLGAVLAFFGACGMAKQQAWAPPALACGIWLWLVGHWSHAVRHRGFYKSRLALAVFERTPLWFERTPLCLTLPVYWQARGRRIEERDRRNTVTLDRQTRAPRIGGMYPPR